MNKNYIIYLPYIGVGGAQYLFARIAEGLIKDGYNVLIIEEEGECFITKYLKNKNLNPTIFKISSEKKYCSNDNDIILLALSYLYKFKEAIIPSSNSLFAFWDLHPFNLVELTGFSKIYKGNSSLKTKNLYKYIEKEYFAKLKKFIELANENKAIYFMSLRNYQANKEFFDININPYYLPIPVNEVKGAKARSLVFEENNYRVLNIAWISRMDKGKVAVLDMLIEDLIKYNGNNKEQVQLHIIGDNKLFFENTSIKNIEINNLKYAGTLINDDLKSYLNREKIDVGFSMGTSALEFASNGILSILVPGVSQVDIFKNDNKRYIYLAESDGYDLVTQDYYINTKAKMFNDIMADIKSNYNNYSKECFQYFNRNHSFANVFKNFIELTSTTSLTYLKLSQLNLTNHSFIQNIIFRLKQLYKNSFI